MQARCYALFEEPVILSLDLYLKINSFSTRYCRLICGLATFVEPSAGCINFCEVTHLFGAELCSVVDQLLAVANDGSNLLHSLRRDFLLGSLLLDHKIVVFIPLTTLDSLSVKLSSVLERVINGQPLLFKRLFSLAQLLSFDDGRELDEGLYFHYFAELGMKEGLDLG